MAFPRGKHLPRRKVRCLGCGLPIMRASHWRKPSCDDCQRVKGNRAKNGEILRLREEARRYRIILHVLGWERDQFWEMVEEMKRSPMMFRETAETRVAKLDLTNERKQRRVS